MLLRHGCYRAAKFSVPAVAAAIAVGVAGCSAPAAQSHSAASPASTARQAPPLKSEVAGQLIYTLADLRSCEVGDALAIAINQASEPLRVTATAVTATGQGVERGSYKIAGVQPGFTGEIASSFHLTALDGYQLAAAPGALLTPVSTNNQGYVFVVLLRVIGKHPQPWEITGLTVRYRLGQEPYATFFPQAIKLPPINCPQS